MEEINKRMKAIEWFNAYSLEEQFYKTIECNHLVIGDRSRHPSTLTGREIELIYNYFQNK